MFVIRKKENINQIKAWGYTAENGGLGDYDPSVYEEVELNSLPENYEIVKELPIATGKSFLEFMVKAIRTQHKLDNLNPIDRSKKITQLENIFTKWKDEDNTICNLWRYLELEEQLTAIELQIVLDKINATKALQGNNGKLVLIENVIALIKAWKDTVRFE